MMKTARKSQKDKTFHIRITDRGAIEAVMMTINALCSISSVVSERRLDTVEELVAALKHQLSNCIRWLDRVPDGTLYQCGFGPKQLKMLKKNARAALDQQVIPSEDDYKKREMMSKQWEVLEKQREEPVANRVKILIDTSFLLSYLSSGSDKNAPSCKMVVSYLKTQRKYFDLCLPNLVVLELISKLKQQYPFKKARAEFDQLLEEISDCRVALNEERMNVFHIFDRYQRFSKKKLSSNLRGNDFIIATDGILLKAMILTCDRRMFEGTKKTYRDVYRITHLPKSYFGFISAFEKRKESLTPPVEK
jgi:predicted nucleic acid-binding protein